MQSQGLLSIERMCQATGVSRAGFYRGWEQKAPDQAANILHNAVKYSPPGEAISVRISTGDTDRVAVEILDEGPGMANPAARGWAFRSPNGPWKRMMAPCA